MAGTTCQCDQVVRTELSNQCMKFGTALSNKSRVLMQVTEMSLHFA